MSDTRDTTAELLGAIEALEALIKTTAERTTEPEPETEPETTQAADEDEPFTVPEGTKAIRLEAVRRPYEDFSYSYYFVNGAWRLNGVRLNQGREASWFAGKKCTFLREL